MRKAMALARTERDWSSAPAYVVAMIRGSWRLRARARTIRYLSELVAEQLLVVQLDPAL